MIHQTPINEGLTLAGQDPVLDVRSPGEYALAHIPGAHSLPLFSDEERKVVGTAYKQQGREVAIKIGLDYFGIKMRSMIEAVEAIVHDHSEAGNKCVLVHCWRGGMRSAGVAWLLDLYGFKVHVLAGGYKAFRNCMLQQFERPLVLKVVGGYTGSGKTEVLKELESAGQRIIDLEGIAGHKGSAFGGIGIAPQPTQEMFENKLGMELYGIADATQPVWTEDESRRIGSVNIPNLLWDRMRWSPVYFLDIPFDERLNYITASYGLLDKEQLTAAIQRIQKRLGGLNAKNAIAHLQADEYKEAFSILLHYYDKYYGQDIEVRSKSLSISRIACDAVNKENYKTLEQKITA